jgi:hypothetical protein
MSVTTRTPFQALHPAVLAIYCSDGRYTRAVEELAEAVGHERIDVLCVPGGPGAMDAWTCGSVILADHLVQQADFLIASHHTAEVLVISHEGCGFYRRQHAVLDDAGRQERQHRDLLAAAALLTRRHPSLRVAAFHARPGGDRIVFQRVG